MISASVVNGTVNGVVLLAVALLCVRCGLQFPVEGLMQERTMAATEIARQAVKHCFILKMCNRVTGYECRNCVSHFSRCDIR